MGRAIEGAASCSPILCNFRLDLFQVGSKAVLPRSEELNREGHESERFDKIGQELAALSHWTDSKIVISLVRQFRVTELCHALGNFSKSG